MKVTLFYKVIMKVNPITFVKSYFKRKLLGPAYTQEEGITQEVENLDVEITGSHVRCCLAQAPFPQTQTV